MPHDGMSVIKAMTAPILPISISTAGGGYTAGNAGERHVGIITISTRQNDNEDDTSRHNLGEAGPPALACYNTAGAGDRL